MKSSYVATHQIIHSSGHSDGVGRTGTFICIHAQLERLKTEGVVDFFQFIKSARIQKPGMISDLVSILKFEMLVYTRICSYSYVPKGLGLLSRDFY